MPGDTDDDKKAYSLRLIIDPGSANAKKIADAMVNVANEKWKDKGVQRLRELEEEGRTCYLKKEYKNKKTREVYAGFEGKHSVSARKKVQPSVFGRGGTQVTDPAAIKQLIYSGCRVSAALDIYVQDNGFGQRINAGLMGVRFMADDASLGGARAASADVFSDIVDEEESLV
jgi:hypothetical protein